MLTSLEQIDIPMVNTFLGRARAYVSVNECVSLSQCVSVSESVSVGESECDCMHFHNFKCGLDLKWGPPSLMRTTGLRSSASD